MTKKNYGKNGFTLIELMVVFVIIALAAAISLPAYFNSIKNAELQKDAQMLITALRLARDTAMNEKGRVGVSFDTSKNSMKLYRVAPGGKTEPLKGEQGAPYNLSRKSSFNSVTVSGHNALAVEYSPLGTTAPATIVIKGDGGSVRVDVDPVTGDASIVEGLE